MHDAFGQHQNQQQIVDEEKNSSRARRVPARTPDLTLTHSEVSPFTTTLCSLSERYEMNHSKNFTIDAVKRAGLHKKARFAQKEPVIYFLKVHRKIHMGSVHLAPIRNHAPSPTWEKYRLCQICPL